MQNTSAVLTGIAFVITMLVGWGINISKLVDMNWDILGVESLLRIIGLAIVPLGAIMGYFV